MSCEDTYAGVDIPLRAHIHEHDSVKSSWELEGNPCSRGGGEPPTSYVQGLTGASSLYMLPQHQEESEGLE